MVVNLEYGYDVARSAIDFTPGKPSLECLWERPGGEGAGNQGSPRPLAGEGQGVRAARTRTPLSLWERGRG